VCRTRPLVTLFVPAIVLALLSAPVSVNAYSVLAHESAIDVAWDRELRPLLLQRFPGTTPEALERARSFAYGGSVIQDLGYYPFGNKFFSNLLHYARTGDFVDRCIRNAQTVDELAFALGALAHYANDIAGHPRRSTCRCRARFPSCARSSATRSPTCRRPSSTSSSSSRSTWRARRAGATTSRSTARCSTSRCHAAPRARLPRDLRSRDGETCSPTKSAPSRPTATRSASSFRR
jgi:hypothetical protein